MTENQVLYQRARSRWGDAAQQDMLIEECGELIVTLLHLRRGRCSTAELASEIADVQIMLEQVIEIADIHQAVRVARQAKLERLRYRLEAP